MLNVNLFYRNFVEEIFIEFIWTAVPACLLIFIALPSLSTLYILEDSFEASLNLKTIGHQWYWSYEYRDYKMLEYDSYIERGDFRLLEVDNSLVLPVNHYICITISSTDVIHSWAVPRLGLKCDAIPGRINQLLFLVKNCGVYFGQCSEICGRNHSFIPIKVEGVRVDIFSNWIIENS